MWIVKPACLDRILGVLDNLSHELDQVDPFIARAARLFEIRRVPAMAEAKLAEANALFIDEMYVPALEAYSAAIQHGADGDAGAFASRAAAYLKLSKFTEALQDANTAIKLDARREVAYYRKGIACFSLDEFEAAKSAFERGLALMSEASGGDSRKYATWIRKCEIEIEDDDDDDDDAVGEGEEERPQPPA